MLNVGKVVSFEEISVGRGGIILHYSGELGCSAHLSVLCDPGMDRGTPVLAEPFIADSCRLNVTWNSKYGCEACAQDDFAYVDSPCHTSLGAVVITRTYFQINPYCYGGLSLPASQQSPCSCQNNNGGCDSHSTCIDFFGGRNCTACPKGYYGTGDTLCTPTCSPICQHGGTCAFPQVCICSNTKYTGTSCQTPICEPVCQNGGTCVSPNTCACAVGYNGSYCHIPVCNPSCQNGGLCISANLCDCSSSNYDGAICDQDRTGVSRGVVGALIGIGLVILGIAVAGLVFLYLRHRKLYAEYSKLSNANIPMDDEM